MIIPSLWRKNTRSALETATDARKFRNPESDLHVYEQLTEMMTHGKHDERWKIRAFSQAMRKSMQ